MWGDKSQLLSFNSTTVQLILYYSDDTLFADRLFQFHNGTINTMMFDFEEVFVVVSIPQRYN